MILKMSGPHRIDNLRHYPAETVDRLRGLLVAGAHANPDPHRKGFYDLEDGDRTFYIHVSPIGAILLLATWPREGAFQATLHEAPLAEAVACCG
ncbi:MAG TPA: hypothetical protein VKO18_06010 [Terriglobia bacterium]|nr:hypothetical protein [Terriglobia bacterium]